MKKLSTEMKLLIAGTTLVMLVPSVCAVMSIGVGMAVNDVETQDLNKGEDPPPIVTLVEFEKIEMGMSYREVADLLGAPGVLIEPPAVQEGGGGDGEAVQYLWQNSDVSNMRASFEDGQLAEKTQLYLK